MKTYTLKNPKALGDADPKYGQTYWSYTHDQDVPVMFNLMNGEVGDWSVITAEEAVLKTSTKGTDYHRLKKVTVSGQNPAAQSAVAPAGNDLILQKLDEILAILKPSGYEKAKEVRSSLPAKDKVVELDDKPMTEDSFELGDEPVDLSDIPF